MKPMKPKAIKEWFTAPENAPHVIGALREVAGDGWTIFRPSAFPMLPEGILAAYSHRYESDTSDHKSTIFGKDGEVLPAVEGIYGLSLVEGIASAYGIHSGKSGRGFRVQDCTRQLFDLLDARGLLPLKNVKRRHYGDVVFVGRKVDGYYAQVFNNPSVEETRLSDTQPDQTVAVEKLRLCYGRQSSLEVGKESCPLSPVRCVEHYLRPVAGRTRTEAVRNVLAGEFEPFQYGSTYHLANDCHLRDFRPGENSQHREWD